ncbi:MAG TPA: hypothetical protein VFI52_02495 [Gemmatimonadaceae bacterium]|nr:hypothetical protein [Gemmatimonadaceae bacterium]
MRRSIIPLLGVVLAGTLAPRLAVSQQLDSTLLTAFRWRPIGPANMGGRITDVEGIPSPSKTFYVAAAAGGLWKTTNAGTTFRPVFDNERVASLGDVAIAPSDTTVVYLGTGEEDSRNSISPGGGVWKSTDGARSWKFMGLAETQQIGRIVVDPRNANVVYVAALGHAWGPNRERGLYKSTDGGTTWQLAKFVSEKAGFVDVQLDPSNPDVVWASSWERVRGPYFLYSGGPGSALWKSTDAGKTWAEVKGNGLPETMKGRINFDISRSNPKTMYVMIEADTVMNGKSDKSAKPQVRPSGLYRSVDGGVTWEKRNGTNVRPFYYNQVRVDPKNPERVYFTSTPVLFSDDGGKTARTATQGIHVDHHAMWIDPNDPEHFIVGDDGGVSQTWDRGGNYDFLNVLPLGQFYAVSYDMAIPYRVCGGLQDNGSWCGPSRRRQGPITNAMWFNVGGGDGFYTAQDPTDPNTVYSESQGGNMSRVNVATGERTPLTKPSWRNRYRQFEDSIIITRGDTTQPASRDVQRRVEDLRRRAAADSIDWDVRFNWNTPFFISPHNSSVFYAAGSKVLKSTNRGESLTPISPDLTTHDPVKIKVSTQTTGGITPDNTGAETHSTITALAESPIRAGLLYAGTDDGNVWLSRNDGATWENLTARFAGVPKNTWVNRIEPSAADSNVFYVAFDGHRTNDFTPYLYITTDYGRTFRSIAANLPTGGPDFVHVIREDPYNPKLLFVGTDVGAYVSTDRGGSWQKFMNGLPTVPVHDLKIHPRDHELIAGTHGRSIWIVDIAPLEQLTDSIRSRSVALFAPKVAYEYGQPTVEGQAAGHRIFEAPSPAYGADIWYRLAGGARGEQTRIVISDASGDTIRTLNGPSGAGLHRVTWDLRGKAPKGPALTPAGVRDSIVQARRIAFVIDSLDKAGTLPKETIDRLRTATAGGNTQGLAQMFGFGGGGGGGGRGQGGGGFNPRPGEGAPARGAAAAQGEGVSEAAPVDPGQLGQIAQLFRTGGGGGGGFGGGRGGAPLVNTGDYLVTISVGGERLRQILHVERLPGGGAAGGFAGGDEDDDQDDQDIGIDP